MPTNIDGFTIFGAIEQKWLSIGGPNSPLKHPVTNEFPTFDGVGRRQNFQGGMISWRPNTAAFIVWGLIGERWLQIGAEQFGCPITDEKTTPDRRGRFNHFRAFRPDNSLIGESSIYWLPETGAHEIYGGIRDFWARNGWERSKVGYPVSAEHNRSDLNGGREQQFQHGTIIWSPSSGASFAEPSITLRFEKNTNTIEVDGFRFTSNQTVRLDYQYKGQSGLHQNGADNPITVAINGLGNWSFTKTVPNDGTINEVAVKVTDNASGIVLSKEIFP